MSAFRKSEAAMAAKMAQLMTEEPPIPSVLAAAKVVVSLSGWAKVSEGRQVFMSSSMAIEVLRRAIENEENPVLRLAPEPINPGVL